MGSFFNNIISLTNKRKREQERFKVSYNLKVVQDIILECADNGHNAVYVDPGYLTDNVREWIKKEGFTLVSKTAKAGEEGRIEDVTIHVITWKQ